MKASWTGHMRALAPLLLAFAAFALSFGAATETRAQSPDKFERVVPPKARPTVPKPAAAPTGPTGEMQEIMRKAEAGAQEQGACANVPPGRIETLYGFLDRAKPGDHSVMRLQGIQLFCRVWRISSVFAEAGQKCVRMKIWECSVGGRCQHTADHKGCRVRTGGWSL